MRCILDTNIVVEQLKSGSLPPPTYAGEYAISVISEAELLRLPGMDELELRYIERFLGTLSILPVHSLIARRAAEIGRTRKTKLPDLLIAATAVSFGLPLITKNQKDFKKIPGLKILSSIS